MLKAPVWNGEPLEGKRILVVAEQGLGDEFMFANILPDFARAVGPAETCRFASIPGSYRCSSAHSRTAQVGAYDDRKLISPDGNKELRFIPWAVEERRAGLLRH